MPEPTRRWICRSIFLVLGLLPLVGSVSWAAWRGVTRDAASYRSWLAGQLGLDVRLVRVVHSRPGVTRLEGLNVVDPETEQLVVRCESVEIRRSAAGTGIYLPAASVQPDQFRRLLELLHERLLRQKRLLSRPLLIVVDRVTLPSSGRELQLSEFRLNAARSEQGPAADLHFRWSHLPDSELVRLHLIRDQSGPSAVTSIQLQTGDTPLPCTVFCPELPGLTNLTDEVTFRGNLSWQSSPDGWSADLTGQIAHLQLENCFPSSEGQPATGHALSGPISFTIRRAVARDSWMDALEGRFTAGPGQMSRSMIEAAEQHLSMQLGTLPGRETATEPVEYDELAVQFEISCDRTVLRGICQQTSPGVIMRGPSGPLLMEAREPVQTTVALYRTLWNLPTSQVPIAASRQPWSRLLPLPR